MQRRIIALAIAAIFLPASTAEAASCLPSAAAVRKVQPKAWPKWTYGPKGERCWYAGNKPVFTKRASHPVRVASRRNPPTRKPAPQPATNSQRDWEHHGEKIWPWAMEYRWYTDQTGRAP
jgi:hypothetical protein